MLFVSRLACSNERKYVLVRLVFLEVAVIIGVANGIDAIDNLSSPWVFRKDLLAIYLQARAIAAGMAPSTDLSILGETFIGSVPYAFSNTNWPHATPHPPTLGVLALPLALLTYQHAVMVWLAVQFACLITGIRLIGRGLRLEIPWHITLILVVTFISWHPVIQDIMLAQVNLLFLVLLAVGWLALRDGKSLTAGAVLGLSILVKQVYWPLLLVLLARRLWKAFACAAVVVIAGYFVTGMVIGFDEVARYYLVTAPEVGSRYRSVGFNVSLWAIGWRIFADATSFSYPIASMVSPFIDFAPAAPYASMTLPTLMMVGVVVLLTRMRRLDTSYGMMICVSILVSPIAWSNYLVPLAVPMAIAGRRLMDMKFPPKLSNVLIIVGAISAAGQMDWLVALLVSGRLEPPVLPLSPGVGLLLAFPTAALLVMAWLLVLLDRRGHVTARNMGSVD